MTAIETMPGRIARLPRDEAGLPIPWFITTEAAGKEGYRTAGVRRTIPYAAAKRMCWVCGGKLTRHYAFLLGPSSLINQSSAEPAVHIDCATYSAGTCPYIVGQGVVAVWVGPREWVMAGNRYRVIENRDEVAA